jgi:hypothetical protein
VRRQALSSGEVSSREAPGGAPHDHPGDVSGDVSGEVSP